MCLQPAHFKTMALSPHSKNNFEATLIIKLNTESNTTTTGQITIQKKKVTLNIEHLQKVSVIKNEARDRENVVSCANYDKLHFDFVDETKCAPELWQCETLLPTGKL